MAVQKLQRKTSCFPLSVVTDCQGEKQKQFRPSIMTCKMYHCCSAVQNCNIQEGCYFIALIFLWSLLSLSLLYDWSSSRCQLFSACSNMIRSHLKSKENFSNLRKIHCEAHLTKFKLVPVGFMKIRSCQFFNAIFLFFCAGIWSDFTWSKENFSNSLMISEANSVRLSIWWS